MNVGNGREMRRILRMTRFTWSSFRPPYSLRQR